MYDAVADPYCYDGTKILKNLPGFKTEAKLARFEMAMTAQRADEPLPNGRLSATHYGAIHHHLFQDVYPWAGKYRTVRLSRGRSAFCYPEHIDREMKRLFLGLARTGHLRGLAADAFAIHAAAFLAELNAVHPFREGNGRTQTTFLALLANQAGHPLHLDRLKPETFLKAMISSFRGDERPLVQQIKRLVRP